MGLKACNGSQPKCRVSCRFVVAAIWCLPPFVANAAQRTGTVGSGGWLRDGPAMVRDPRTGPDRIPLCGAPTLDVEAVRPIRDREAVLLVGEAPALVG